MKEKWSSIAFIFVREHVANLEWLNAWLNTQYNPADMSPKSLLEGEKRNHVT